LLASDFAEIPKKARMISIFLFAFLPYEILYLTAAKKIRGLRK